jgi:hypothetical protein
VGVGVVVGVGVGGSRGQCWVLARLCSWPWCAGLHAWAHRGVGVQTSRGLPPPPSPGLLQVSQLTTEVGNMAQARDNALAEWQLDSMRRDAVLKEVEAKRSVLADSLKTTSRDLSKLERSFASLNTKKMEVEQQLTAQFKKVRCWCVWGGRGRGGCSCGGELAGGGTRAAGRAPSGG